MTRLEYERRKRGLTQEQLADALLYERSLVSRLENERRDPDAVNRRLKYSLEAFFGLPIKILLAPIEILEASIPGQRDPFDFLSVDGRGS